jgi:O-acetyl-ADP-ribose deacetylase (regulator of RNase III)
MNEIMKKIGQYEETGKARISKGYYLPSDYIIHTVGPIVNGPLTKKHKKLLSSSYISVLKLAKEKNIKTLAFCCISTGVFNFPNDEASNIAIKTVINFLKNNKDMKVIFCVYKEIDEILYNKKLKEKMEDFLNKAPDDL